MSRASLGSICTGVSSTWCRGLVWLLYVTGVSSTWLHGLVWLIFVLTGVSSKCCRGLVWLVYLMVYLLHGVMV